MSAFPLLRAAVRALLERPDSDWSVQGFGMMRRYLDADKKYRLNIWDSSLAGRNVSIIHDHLPVDANKLLLMSNDPGLQGRMNTTVFKNAGRSYLALFEEFF